MLEQEKNGEFQRTLFDGEVLYGKVKCKSTKVMDIDSGI